VRAHFVIRIRIIAQTSRLIYADSISGRSTELYILCYIEYLIKSDTVFQPT